MPTNLPFWTSEGRDILEPKRQGRFVMGFTNFPYEWYVKTVDLPKFEMSETKHTYLSNTVFFPGDIEWKEMNVTLVDQVAPEYSSVRTLLEIIEKSGYHPLKNQNDRSFISKRRACEVLGGVYIHQLDNTSVGNTTNQYQEVATWTLHNPWVKNIDNGTLEYGKPDLIEVKVTLRFDWADISYPNGTQVFKK